ncbi:MAG: glycosyltransferase family 39 protein [Candidatus Korobacteraceae bacterium]
MSSRRLLEPVLVLGFCLFLFFYGLASFGLTGADEPRYAQVAREMLARHDWVTPVLYGQPWLEKPILYYWRAMVAYKVFGVSDWAARLPSATLATLMVFVVYLFSLRMRGVPDRRAFTSGGVVRGMPLDAALITASSTLLLAMARAASTDMSLAAPFSIAMLCWYAWHESALSLAPAPPRPSEDKDSIRRGSDGRQWLLLVFYVAMALATLAKGPVAPGLAALILIVYCLAVRQPKLIAKTLWIPGILCFLAVALPWYIEVQLRNPQFLRVFLVEHNLARFGTNLFRHPQPFWYYVPIVLLATAPWTLFVILGAVDAVKEWRQRQGTAPDYLPIFLLLWGFVPVLFFSLSRSKLPAYILPSVPAFALLAAVCAHRRMQQGRLSRWLILAHAAICAAVMAAVLLAPALMLKVRPAPRTIIVSSAAAALVFLLVGGALFAKGLPMLRPVTLLPIVVSVAFLLRVAAPSIDAAQSARPLAGFLAGLGVAPGDHVSYFRARRELAYGLAFYRNQSPEVYAGWPALDANEFPSSGTPPAGRFFVLTSIPANAKNAFAGDSGRQAQLRQMLPGREVRAIGFFRPQQVQVFLVSPGNAW